MSDTRVVCLCGSTRWPHAFDLANMHESLMGRGEGGDPGFMGRRP